MLKATDASGNISNGQQYIKIYNSGAVGNAEIKLFDSVSNNPIKNAKIYLEISEGNFDIFNTDDHGKASLDYLSGKYSVKIFKPGYLPESFDIIIGSANEKYEFGLVKSDIIISETTVERLDLDKIIEKGIDITDPDNQHIFEYFIYFRYQGKFYTDKIILNRAGVLDREFPYPDLSQISPFIPKFYYPLPDEFVMPPMIAYVFIPGEISWLKEFFEVRFTFTNLASEEFVIKDSFVKLDVPMGLTLAKTKEMQSSYVDLGDIKGQEGKELSWVLRGDTKGKYDVNINMMGQLYPFDETINVKAHLEDAIDVKGFDTGLHIYAKTQKSVLNDAIFPIEFRLKNEGEVPLYNVSTRFGSEKFHVGVNDNLVTIVLDENGKEIKKIEGTEGHKNLTFKAKNLLNAPILFYGETLVLDVLYPNNEVYANILRRMVSDEWAGSRDGFVIYDFVDSSISRIDGTTENMIPLTVEIFDNKLIENISTKIWQEYLAKDKVADPVNTFTGAYEVDLNAFSVVSSKGVFPFNIKYDSKTLASINTTIKENEFDLPESNFLNTGSVGKGWSHNFETSINKGVDGSANVRWTPYNWSVFEDENKISYEPISKPHNENDKTEKRDDYKITRKVYGKLIDGKTIEIIQPKFEAEEKVYYDKADKNKRFKLIEKKDGTFELVNTSGEVLFFDKNGLLIKISESDGRIITINRDMENTLVIKEEKSYKELILSYNEIGLIKSVSDETSKETTFNYDDNKNLIKISFPDGSLVRYTYDENGFITSEMDENSIIYVKNTYDDLGRVVSQDDSIEDGNFSKFEYFGSDGGEKTTVYTDRNGNSVHYNFNEKGQMSYFQDQRGYITNYIYNEEGNLFKTINPDNTEIKYYYDDLGNINKIIDEEGYSKEFLYDDRGNLLSEKNDLGIEQKKSYTADGLIEETQSPGGLKVNYNYNSKGELISQNIEGLGEITYNYTDGMLTSTTDIIGNVTTMSYNASGFLESAEGKGGSAAELKTDLMGNITSVKNSLGNETIKEYDRRGNVISSTDTKGNKSFMKYDGNRNLIETTDPLGNGVILKYDGEDRLKEIINSNGEKTSFNYDKVGNTIEIINAKGNIEKYSYDSRNRVKSITDFSGGVMNFEYFNNGLLKNVTDAAGNSIAYKYDKALRLEEVISSTGNSVKYKYDIDGNITEVTDALNNSTKSEYDIYGNLISSTDKNGNITIYKYNKQGLVTLVKDPLGNETQYIYNSKGNIEKIINARGNSKHFSYDEIGRVRELKNELGNSFQVSYDENSNISSLNDSYGEVLTEYHYDELNRVISVVDANGNSTKSIYDKVGRLLESINESNEGTKYSYDELGNLINVTDSEGGESSQTFDESGNVLSITDPNGGITNFEYDQLSNLKSETTAIGTRTEYFYNAQSLLEEVKNGRGQIKTFSYDELGRIKSFEDADGNVEYKYDNNGNILEIESEEGIISREYDSLNRLIKYVDTKGNVIGYQYNEVGSLSALTYPDGKVVTYVYDDAEQLTKVIDWSGRSTNYEYDKNGRLVKTVHANGTNELIEYDKAGRIIKKTEISSSGAEISSFDYEYDEKGNILSETNVNQTGLENLEEVEMTYTQGNQIESYNGEAVIYDKDGNMLYGPNQDGMIDYAYDSRNRLIKAGDIEYKYDAENIRYESKSNGIVTEYVTNPNARLSQVLISKDSDGKTRYYVYGIGLLGHEDESGYKTYHYDYRGSTTYVTNELGEITDTFSYGAYGELLNKSGSGKIKYLYNGKYGVETEGNGLYYMRARYYNPTIKRFINQDILIGSITDGTTLNRHSYVQGNPISLIDPFGLSAESLGMNTGGIHLVLGLLGNLPYPAGTLFDLADALIYAVVDKDYISALGSIVNAVIPIPGIGSGLKAALKAVDFGIDAYRFAEATENRDLSSTLASGVNILLKTSMVALPVTRKSFVKGDLFDTPALKTKGRSMDGIDTKQKLLTDKRHGQKLLTEGSGKLITNKFANQPADLGTNVNYKIVDGKFNIADRNGRQVYDFIVNSDGALHIGDKHSFLANNKSVLAAGQIKLDSNGYLRNITNSSGHYRPTTAETLNFPEYFRNAGVSTKNAWLVGTDWYIDPKTGFVDPWKSHQAYSKQLLE